jgi:SAM-dependent methyltransferase
VVHVGKSRWDQVAREPKPSWYLDPLVAEQKRVAHQQLIRKWAAGSTVRSVLKTDLFEEAFGADRLLFDLFPNGCAVIGIDLSLPTVNRAMRKCALQQAYFLVSDVRALALQSNLVDLIVSNSTLDHFDSEAEFQVALSELVRILRPGGLLIITLDNPLNPFYRLLRGVCRLRYAPFPLGYTTSLSGLARTLEKLGLEVVAKGTLIHNPRLISTMAFLGLRRLLGRHADRPIRGLLKLFARLERLPTRAITACFVAACARKPESKMST